MVDAYSSSPALVWLFLLLISLNTLAAGVTWARGNGMWVWFAGMAVLFVGGVAWGRPEKCYHEEVNSDA